MAKTYPRVEVMQLSDLCAVADATRTVSTEAFYSLKKQYELLGVIQFPTYNVRTKRLLGGKLGVRVLRDAGETTAQVICVDLAPELEDASIMALNNHAGEWEWRPVSEQLKAMKVNGTMMLSGFRDFEIGPLEAAVWSKEEVESDVKATERQPTLL